MKQNGKRHSRIAILGGGPCGNTLAILLAEKGVDVTIFDRNDRPDLIVGESLVPSVLTILRRLGIEKDVSEIGLRKPGATIRISPEDEIKLDFEVLRGIGPDYAYNVRRPAFDELLDRRAEKAGVRRVESIAEVVIGNSPHREVELSEETRKLVPDWEGEHPDLIVDASGRKRVLCRLLDIPAQVGPRKDVAYFAHYTGFEEEEPRGQIVVSRLRDSGWSWRIQLPDRMSVGVVLGIDVARNYGDTPEERLENIIDSDPDLSQGGKDRKRLSDVPVYSNYQLITTRGAGPGWVAAGDAYGFVDPMLSSGLFLAMWSAAQLADFIASREIVPSNGSFRGYEKEMITMLESWHELVDRFYDGGLVAVYKHGKKMVNRYERWPLISLVDRHISRQLAGMMAGFCTDRRYSRSLLEFLNKFGTGSVDPSDLAIK